MKGKEPLRGACLNGTRSWCQGGELRYLYSCSCQSWLKAALGAANPLAPPRLLEWALPDKGLGREFLGALHGEGRDARRHDQSKGPKGCVSSASSPHWSPGFAKLVSIQPSCHKLPLTSPPRWSFCPGMPWSPLSGGLCCPPAGSLLVSWSAVHTQTPALWLLGEAKTPHSFQFCFHSPHGVHCCPLSSGGCFQLLPAPPKALSSCF